MGTLKIGRVGLDVTLDTADSQRERGSETEIRGHFRAATLAETVALRTELLAQRGYLIAVTHSDDPAIDGYYIQGEADVEASAQVRSLATPGFFRFSVALGRAGKESLWAFESQIAGGIVDNDHSIGTGEPFISPPIGSFAWHNGASAATKITRTGEDGAADVWIDLVTADDIPRWSCAPADFYTGAVEVSSAGRLRAGLFTPNDTADWQLSNGLVRVTPNATNGRIDVEHHDGTSWDAAKTWQVSSGGTEISSWEAIGILTNTPEHAVIRLTSTPSDTIGHVTLDMALRRGSRFVACVFSRAKGSATLKIQRSTTEAGTAGTGFVRATANDGSGNRYVVGSAKSHTADTTNGGLSKSTDALDFFLGSEVGGSGAQAGDAAADLVNQYVGYVRDVTRPVRR